MAEQGNKIKIKRSLKQKIREIKKRLIKREYFGVKSWYEFVGSFTVIQEDGGMVREEESSYYCGIST